MKMVVALVVGAVLAVASLFSLVQSATQDPDPVSQDLVVYGDR